MTKASDRTVQPECTRHGLPFGAPDPTAPTDAHVVRCAHLGDKFIVAIEGSMYRFLDFVQDLEDGDVRAELLFASRVPVDAELASREWALSQDVLLSDREPVS